MDTEQYQTALTQQLIGFSVKNHGVHLIVEGPNGLVDVWPTTGKWKDRTGPAGFGLRSLMQHLTGSYSVHVQQAPRQHLELSHETACWLKGVVQNPLWTSPEEEPAEDSRARKEIWDVLQHLQP